MAKLAAKKKPTKPDAPKKPSSRSKTGNAECSQAASNWQLSIRGKATLNPGTYQTLAKCRAMNRTGKMAEAQGRTGKLSAMGESAVKARLQARFDSGLITQKSRNERLNMLLKQRSERGKVEAGKAATNDAKSSQPAKGPMRYQEFIASGRTGNEWDAYAAEQNKLIGLRQAKKVRDDWRSGKSVSGQTVLGWLDNKNVRVSSDMRRFLQHDKTIVSTSGIEGVDAKKYGSKVQNLIGQYIGGRTEQRSQRAEFLLKQRSERGKIETAKTDRSSYKSSGVSPAIGAPKPLRDDPAIVNLPLDKRGGGSIDSQLDRYKKEQSKAKKAEIKDRQKTYAEERADILVMNDKYGPELAKRMAKKLGKPISEVRSAIRDIIHRNPAQARKMFEQEAKAASTPSPASVPKAATKAKTPVVAKPAITAENKGTYGDYYFTPEGKYVSMSGSGGLGSSRVGARDINGKMIGWYDRKELRFANEKQRPTKESEIASERLSAISKEVSDLREKNARLLIGRDTTDKLRRELSQGKITKEKYGELVQKGYALSDKDYALSGEVQKQIESVKSRLVQRGTETGGKAIPPKPPARYSLGGKLAPGRGTEERKRTAEYILETRKQIAKKTKLIDRNLSKSNRSGYSSQTLAKNVSDKQRFAWNLASMRQYAKRLTGKANLLSR